MTARPGFDWARTRSSIRARLRRFFRPPRTLSFTREGKYFVAITVGVGFAAINTGNNLLYLLLGMMLSFIIASGILSELSLRELSVTRAPPDVVYAERPVLIGIGLTNNKRRFSSFSIEVEDLVDGKALDKKCYFLKIPTERTQTTSYRHAFPTRGRYTFTAFRLSTKFPFTLFKKSRVMDGETTVLVYPAIHPVAPPSDPRAAYAGDEAPLPRGRRGEFHGLREFREGDDPRDIHWRSSARRGRQMIREHDDEASRRITLFCEHVRPSADAAGDALVERGISLCASLIIDYLDRGYVVRLVTRSGQIGWAAGRGAGNRFLEKLALLPILDGALPWSGEAEGSVAPVYVMPGQDAPQRRAA